MHGKVAVSAVGKVMRDIYKVVRAVIEQKSTIFRTTGCCCLCVLRS